jgi:cysteine-rich repeat protein
MRPALVHLRPRFVANAAVPAPSLRTPAAPARSPARPGAGPAFSLDLAPAFGFAFAFALALGAAGCRCGGNGETDSGGSVGSDTGTDSGGGTDAATDSGGGGGTDSAPPAVCGNGLTEGAEACDDGNTSVDDFCLNDCTLACGDGTVNAVEQCDTGIATGPGACPTTCDDGDACTTDSLSGAGCDAVCMHGTIAALIDGDGCCPPGGDASSDDDCPPVCDNGLLEPGETCDPSAGCPTACDDGNACTVDTLSGAAATCDAACTLAPLTGCIDGDGCCPAGCCAPGAGCGGGDTDCSTTCGNGVVDAGETCDPAATCTTSCDDADACTTDVLTGSAANCNVACSHGSITAPIDGDGCCPAGGNANSDSDCLPVCGNGAVESGEQCDDGNLVAGDGCDATCMAEPTVFRASDADLRDPHIYVDVPFVGCTDVTDSAPLGQASANDNLQDAVTMDGDGDGFLDLSLMLIFRPLDQVSATGNVDVATGLCTDPIATTSCDLDPAVPAQPTTYTNMSSGTCLAPYPGTVSTAGYVPAITDATASCFVTAAVTITLDLQGTMVPLYDAQVGGTYVGAPATSLTNGLMRGFISETDADLITIDLGPLGMATLSSLLPGGTGNCASHDDRDVGLDGVTMGWWFYLNFPADVVTYTGP